jgi:hypothetical protein
VIPGLLFCAASAALVAALARRSLGHGLGALFAVGYVYGIVRANLFDGVSHFAFDLAIVSLYATTLPRASAPAVRAQARLAASSLKVLFLVPVAMFFVPLQHPLIQVVGLRAAILFLPMVLVGARMTPGDLHQLARWLVGLNGAALAVATAEYVLGLDHFFPRNELTRIVYASADVGTTGALRIPSTFSSSHAFGGTMVATLPFLAAAAERAAGRRRALTIAILGASVLGVFMCGARSPVVHLFALAALALVGTPMSARARLRLAALAILVLALVSTSDRLQRFTTLLDGDRVTERVRGSAHVGIVDALLEYPFGAGLGRAVGTSIPYFLQHLAPEQIGAENEFARIALEQGVVGLAVFLGFVAVVLARPTGRNPIASPLVARLFRYLVALMWGTAFIGTGILTSIPGTALLLLMMGVLLARRDASRAAADGVPRPAAPVAHEGRAA